MSKKRRSKGQSEAYNQYNLEQEQPTKLSKKEIRAAQKIKNQAQNGTFSKDNNSQEEIEMARTGEDPWEGHPLSSNNAGQGRNRQEKTYPALPPAKETIAVTPTQSKKTGAITDQEVKDYIANANPENINDVMKMTATFLASQDPERVIATAKAAMEESNAKKPKQTGSLISRITSFCCLYLGHLAALIFLAFISGSTDMIRLMLTAPFLILLFIGELILCKRLTTNNE